MPSLLLSRSEVARLLEPAALLPEIREGFRAYSQVRSVTAQRARSDLPGRDPQAGGRSGSSATVLFPGLLPGIPAYSVKVHAKFPGRDPAIRGLLLLHDLATGELLVVMESAQLTALRTGLAGAVAAEALARPEAGRVAIVGAGAQGEHQLRGLGLVRRLSSVSVYDSAPFKTGAFVRRMAAETAAKLVPADTLAEAVAETDIVVCATWSRQPFLFEGMVPEGVHITTLGPDEPGKLELDAGLLQAGSFFCDDRELAVQMGAVGNAGLGNETVAAELGEVIAGRHPGRTHPGEITIYGGVGLAWQDLAAAWQVYRRALELGIGRRVDFWD